MSCPAPSRALLCYPPTPTAVLASSSAVRFYSPFRQIIISLVFNIFICKSRANNTSLQACFQDEVINGESLERPDSMVVKNTDHGASVLIIVRSFFLCKMGLY